MTSTDNPTNTFAQDKAAVTERVRKLLNQAENPGCTTEEAEAFSAKAQALISRFSIDLSVLSDGKRADELIERKIIITDPYATAKVTLYNAVVRANDCRCVRYKKAAKDEKGLYIYTAQGNFKLQQSLSVVGYATDVEWVETLCASLEHQLTFAVARDKKTRTSRDNLRAWTTSYIDGFAYAISARLQEARRKVVAEAQEKVNADHRELLAVALDNEVIAPETSVALVLVAKTVKVEAEYKRIHPYTTTTYRKGGSSYAGRSAGAAAGRSASLARGSVGGGGKALGR